MANPNTQAFLDDVRRWRTSSSDHEEDDEVEEESNVTSEHFAVCILAARIRRAVSHPSWIATDSAHKILSWYQEPVLPSPVERPERIVEKRFHELVEKWRKETRFISSIRRKVLHPSYQQIIGMGPSVVPLILKELEQRPSHWFWALNALTQDDPVPEDADFDRAVNAWLIWGHQRQYL